MVLEARVLADPSPTPVDPRDVQGAAIRLYLQKPAFFKCCGAAGDRRFVGEDA
jgi:hypothetical protein